MLIARASGFAICETEDMPGNAQCRAAFLFRTPYSRAIISSLGLTSCERL